jgi:hypothetical protein
VHQSWNFRDIYANTFGRTVNEVFTPNGFYPLRVAGIADNVPAGVGVKGGSASYYKLGVAAGAEALVKFSSGQGAPNTSFRFTVIRTK